MTGKITQKKLLKEDGTLVYHERYWLDGKEVTEEEFKKVFPDKPIHSGDRLMISTSWSKPIKSDGAGVHPKQRLAAIQHAEKHGIPTDFTEGGAPVFTSRQHRKKYLKLIGMHDNEGGYSDG